MNQELGGRGYEVKKYKYLLHHHQASLLQGFTKSPFLHEYFFCFAIDNSPMMFRKVVFKRKDLCMFSEILFCIFFHIIAFDNQFPDLDMTAFCCPRVM